MFRRLIPCGIALAALTISTTANAAAALQSVSLRPADMPGNYHKIVMGKQSDVELVTTKLSAKVYSRHGRLSGYMAEFAPRHSLPTVASLAVRYRTSAGAHWEVQNVRSYEHANGVSVPGVGQEWFAYVLHSGTKKNRLDLYGIAFREGPFAIEITEAGRPGSVTVNDVLHYARVVDARAKQG